MEFPDVMFHLKLKKAMSAVMYCSPETRGGAKPPPSNQLKS